MLFGFGNGSLDVMMNVEADVTIGAYLRRDSAGIVKDLDRVFAAIRSAHDHLDLLFTAAAGGVGITLTAARYLIRLQRPWSRVDDVQALNRVHRIGSEIHESIIVIDYVTEGTIENRVMKVLDEKGQSFEDIVKDQELLRRALESDDDDE